MQLSESRVFEMLGRLYAEERELVRVNARLESENARLRTELGAAADLLKARAKAPEADSG